MLCISPGSYCLRTSPRSPYLALVTRPRLQNTLSLMCSSLLREAPVGEAEGWALETLRHQHWHGAETPLNFSSLAFGHSARAREPGSSGTASVHGSDTWEGVMQSVTDLCGLFAIARWDGTLGWCLERYAGGCFSGLGSGGYPRRSGKRLRSMVETQTRPYFLNSLIEDGRSQAF